MNRYEIEQKFRIRNPRAIRGRLRQLGARKIRGGREENEFYDDRRDSLLSAGKILRLRRSGRYATITLKGRKMRQKYSKRMDIETPVDFLCMKELLRQMGYRLVERYAKTREVFELGGCEVTMDQMPGFGRFLEIEGRTSAITSLAKKLDLTSADREERSYLQMRAEKKKGRLSL